MAVATCLSPAWMACDGESTRLQKWLLTTLVQLLALRVDTS